MSTRRGRRGGGRGARRAERLARVIEQQPFLTRRLDQNQVLSAEGMEIIEHNADTLLEQVGIEVVDFPEALAIFSDGGAEVDGTRVRFPRGMCREIISRRAPSSFVQHARNPQRSVTIGDPHTVFAPAYGSPFVRDRDEGRRYATIEDFRNFTKLTYMSPALHHGGGTLCEPVDLPIETRHLDMIYSHVVLHDKPFMSSVTRPERAQDSVDLAKVVFGEQFVADNTVLIGLCNANSPMQWDRAMLGSAQVLAENNQCALITPFIIVGAMSPVTVAATATQTLAEAMAAMSFTQLVRPGAPVIMGSFATTMSMQTGAPTFGTPEAALALLTIRRLAARLGVPFRSGGNLTASKIPDAQAAYESFMTFLPALSAGVNFVLHSAGWLEGGLTMSYEKFVLDADQISMMARLVGGVDLSENGLALDALLSNEPGQHFLGAEHTLTNFESAFWVSDLGDNSSFEQWELDGALTSVDRAHAEWNRLLSDYEAPPIDDAVRAELEDWIMARKATLLPDSPA
ncbi:MAG: trimethylamine methyltransferase family protein [Acidimicrobiia bacterium]|nr:trimethylamine methyltransferase family protein [bacterium]MDE0644280.1 trimethylamine methyltransferase family protein [bacterium]MXZ07320.1 trimethylamine methyltransferase family protein [Acidimicrobiia bacterium]MYF26685.1 trimethylamine methyltransferase family protein [Acidimicrobiia bacterium]